MFSGMGFSMYPGSVSFNCAYTDNITYVSLTRGIYDEFFASDNPNLPRLESSKKWDYDTIFFAKFQNNLMAGNVDYSANTVNAMLIKRKKASEFNWITLFEVPIEKNEDFNFERIDRYARAQTDYQYALIPVMSGVEGEMNLAEIYSNFYGSFIVESDVSYSAFMNLSVSTQKIHNGTAVATLGSKFPYYISNGITNYYTGTINCTFIQMVDCELQLETSAFYRENVDDFLCNGQPKIYKIFDGRIYMINITDTINQDAGNNIYAPNYSINFVEIGDAENQDDLYDNGFIDVDYRLQD